MLVYEQNGDILALLGETLKRSFNVRVLCLGIYNEEVLLRIWRLGNVLKGSLRRLLYIRSQGLTPTPARSMPVTVSWAVSGV
jgi:hypothetical protein